MQHTINKLAEVIQKKIDHDEAGLELAVAMAQDDMSYYDAHCKIHHLMDALEYAERYLAKAAFKELARDGKRMNPANMISENPGKHY